MLPMMVLAAGLLAADAPAFADATTEEPIVRDAAANGKSIAKIRDEVKLLWPTIAFEKDGKQVEYKVKFETDDGDIEVGFYPDKAPNHARSFICLAKAGYFDGLNFHRCINEFMIQGGCPYGNGGGGPGYRLKAEFNNLPHGPGVLSAARTNDPNSAGSQFFLCLTRQRTQHLDGEYTVFGKVLDAAPPAVGGMDVVRKIVARPSRDPRGERPDMPCKIKKATVLMAVK